MDEPVARERIRVESVATPVVAPVVEDENLLNWGSIWAGVLTAFGIFVLLSLIALAAGFETAPFADPPADLNIVASIVTGIFLVVAFFAGGFTAIWTAEIGAPERAILHGFLVWAAFLVLLLVLIAAGLGGALGSMTRAFTGEFDAETAADVFEDAAWGTVFGMVLAVTASILGGLVATRDEVRARWPSYR